MPHEVSGIHEEMLKDEVRTTAYMRAIVDNAHLFRGKVVLDVGCGTGILSMFAARAGARKVFAVDFAKIVDQAKEIVRDNRLDHIVEVLEGKVEDIVLPGFDKVDIIVSEWMGYFLFYESMLGSVIVARDRFLKPGGIMFPDVARLYICGIEDAQYKSQKIDFWENVYGFDMSCIKSIAMTEPLVDVVDAAQIVTDIVEVLTIDMNIIRTEELTFSVPFRLRAEKSDFCHAVVAFFDVDFARCHRKVTISTSPLSRATHWKQTVFYLDEAVPIDVGDLVTGSLAVRPSTKNHRDLDIAIRYMYHMDDRSGGTTLRYRLR